MQPFKDLLETDRIHVVDGAMGTMLYAKGVYINRCYDELNLSNPDLVREIHTEYIKAGADIIETNTFGATAHKLQQYGLEANLHEINVIAAKVAREAAGDRAHVAVQSVRSVSELNPSAQRHSMKQRIFSNPRLSRYSKAELICFVSRRFLTFPKCFRLFAPYVNSATCQLLRR